jgi:AcrR family transcriptional regulator
VARPSLKTQRTEEILDAFTRCIAEHGIQGASLERIADEAGMARQILRHYVGNRDDLIVALAERFAAQTQTQLQALAAGLPTDNRIQIMLDILLSSDTSGAAENLVADALLLESQRLPEVKEKMTAWLESLNRFVINELKQANPKTSPSKRRAIATAVVSLLLVGDSLQSIVAPSRFKRDARLAAEMLIGL